MTNDQMDLTKHPCWSALMRGALQSDCERCGTPIDREHKETGPLQWAKLAPTSPKDTPMTIDPVELERLSKAATAPGALIADKGAFLVALETAYRTGQLVPAQPSDILSPDAIRDCLVTTVLATPAQPSGDVVEAVARAIMVTNGACFVKDWTTERRDNPHVALAWDQATAAITAYEAVSGVANMREALREIGELTERRQLPLTNQINDIVLNALRAQEAGDV